MRFSSAWLSFRLAGYRENHQGQGKVIDVPITAWRSGGEDGEASLKTIGKAISTRPSGDVRQWGGGMVYPHSDGTIPTKRDFSRVTQATARALNEAVRSCRTRVAWR